MRPKIHTGAFVLALALYGPGVLGAAPVDLEGGVVLENGMQDVRLREVRREKTGDLFDRQIPSKSQSYAAYFNGKTMPPSMSFPEPQADTDPNVLTSGEQESGLKQWWNAGSGASPDDAAKAEFDKVAGDLMATRFYTFAGPLAADLKAKGYTPAQIAGALVYDKTGAAGQQAGFSYRGLIFGAGAAEAGMSFSRAKQQMTENGISAAHAEEVLRKDYGAVTLAFYFQKKVKERGDWTSDLYTKVDASIPKYQAYSGTTINATFHPGTQTPVPMPEPFDPGDPGAGTDPQALLEHNMEVAAVYTPATGPALNARSFLYVENYRQITSVDANFTGEMASDQVPNSVPVQPGARRGSTLPLTAADGGQASFSLEDPAQQNGNLTANVDIGDGLNGYVIYFRDPVNKAGSVVLRWESARPMPAGQTTRNNTRYAGPVFATPSGEANNVFQEIAADYENLYELNLSAENRRWFDPIVFNANGSPNRPEVCEAIIKDKWKAGGDPFNGYDPRVAFPNENGYQTKISLNFDKSESAVGTEQTTSIFKPGDVILSQVYTQDSPTGKLYKLASENTPEDQKVKDVKGNTIEPTGENVTLQAQTCCGVTSIVGGSVVKKDDQNRPNAQISAVEQGTTGTGARAVPVAVTAGVPNDPNGAHDPIGEYHLLYPLSRIQAGLPALPASGTGIQGQDAKFYGDFVNDAPVWANAPLHPEHRALTPRTLGNPVDAQGTPFMSMHAATDPTDPKFQDFRQGHRYEVTIAAWDNLSPLIMPPMPDRGIPGYVCYPVRKLTYKLVRADKVSGEPKAALFDGVVVDAPADSECIDKEPVITLEWVPHADGPHYWVVDVEDIEGNTRQLVTQVDVTAEDVSTRQIENQTQRQR
jgi:hypothetical protein